jgi:hypothetical protein
MKKQAVVPRCHATSTGHHLSRLAMEISLTPQIKLNTVSPEVHSYRVLSYSYSTQHLVSDGLELTRV